MESNDNLQQIRRAAEYGDNKEQYYLGRFYEEKVIGEDMDNEESWMNSVIYRFTV